MAKNTKEKEPGIAAVLNIIPGLGYLYIGTRKPFAVLLLVSLVLSIVSYFDPATMDYINDSSEADISIFAVGGLLSIVLLTAAFVVDAYQEAKRVNKKQVK